MPAKQHLDQTRVGGEHVANRGGAKIGEAARRQRERLQRIRFGDCILAARTRSGLSRRRQDETSYLQSRSLRCRRFCFDSTSDRSRKTTHNATQRKRAYVEKPQAPIRTKHLGQRSCAGRIDPRLDRPTREIIIINKLTKQIRSEK